MRRHRFILDFEAKERRLKISDKEFLNQIKNVLRLKVGDRIILSDGKLTEAEAKITGWDKSSAEIEIIDRNRNQNEPEIFSTLYCAVLKRENFELVVQKATEVGISRIIPLITKRTIKFNLRMDRLNKIIREAAEQSGRGVVPVLEKPRPLVSAFEEARANDLNLFFDPTGQSLEKFDPKKRKTRKIGIFVGPEGGWDEEEIESAENDGCAIATLGRLTLRAETAAIVASYLGINL